MSARSRLIDRATLVVADERARSCPHTRPCRCRGKWRVMTLGVVAALLDAGWTLTPPAENSTQP